MHIRGIAQSAVVNGFGVRVRLTTRMYKDFLALRGQNKVNKGGKKMISHTFLTDFSRNFGG